MWWTEQEFDETNGNAMSLLRFSHELRLDLFYQTELGCMILFGVRVFLLWPLSCAYMTVDDTSYSYGQTFDPVL